MVAGIRRPRFINGSILSNFSRLELSTADEKTYMLEMTPFNRLAMRLIGVPHLGFRMRARIIISEARKSKSDAKILDAGCGYGLYSMSLAEAGYRMDASDIDERRINELNKMASEYPVLKEHISASAASLTQLPYASGSYDTVICSEVIEHIPNDRAAVSELARVLKSGGRLILSVPYDSPFNKREYRRFDHQRPGYTKESLQALFAPHGVSIEKAFYYEHPFGSWLFNIFNSLTSKPLMGLAFYPMYLLYLCDYAIGAGVPNQIVVVARKA